MLFAITSFKKSFKFLIFMDYEALLERAKKALPEDKGAGNRFEIPKVKGHIQGSRTVVNNFVQIANFIGRDPNHLLKYVNKELATPGEIIKQAAIFKSKISAAKLNEKIEKYVNEFVVCKECGKPDTKLVKEGTVMFIKCQACGAKKSVYTKK